MASATGYLATLKANIGTSHAYVTLGHFVNIKWPALKRTPVKYHPLDALVMGKKAGSVEWEKCSGDLYFDHDSYTTCLDNEGETLSFQLVDGASTVTNTWSGFIAGVGSVEMKHDDCPTFPVEIEIDGDVTTTP